MRQREEMEKKEAEEKAKKEAEDKANEAKRAAEADASDAGETPKAQGAAAAAADADDAGADEEPAGEASDAGSEAAAAPEAAGEPAAAPAESKSDVKTFRSGACKPTGAKLFPATTRAPQPSAPLLPPPLSPSRCRAIIPYSAKSDKELSFDKDDIVIVISPDLAAGVRRQARGVALPCPLPIGRAPSLLLDFLLARPCAACARASRAFSPGISSKTQRTANAAVIQSSTLRWASSAAPSATTRQRWAERGRWWRW